MTIATDRGFEIGKTYIVVKDSMYYKEGMTVKFTRDDGTRCPSFTLVSGEPNRATKDFAYYIDLDDLIPSAFKETINSKSVSTKDLLILYVQQHHALDEVLKALVESL